MYYFCGEVSVLFQNLLKSRSVQPITNELIRNNHELLKYFRRVFPIDFNVHLTKA